MTSHRSRIGVFMADSDLVVRFWDRVMVEMTGLSKGSAWGQCLTNLLPNLKTSSVLARFQRVLDTGQLEIWASTLHPPLILCPPAAPSRHFSQMQQHITIAPWRDQTAIVGTIVTIEDITAQLEQEQDLVHQTMNLDNGLRLQMGQVLMERYSPKARRQLLKLLADRSWSIRRLEQKG